MERNEHIPVRNLYYLLAYAFRSLHLAAWQKAGTEPFRDVQNLFAALFAEGIGWQLKQGLPRDYVRRRDDLPGLRGRLYMPGVIADRAARRPRLACEYDEFSENHLLNRILRAAAEALLRAPRAERQYKVILRRELAYFSGVNAADLSRVPWSRLAFPRRGGHVEWLVHLAELLTKGLLMTEERGGVRLRETLTDDALARLYEKFLLGWFRWHFPQLHPESRRIPWAAEGEEAYLPAMQSDVTLSDGTRELILDAKCYSRTMQEHWGRRTQHSHNLYQIFTYVKNREALPGPARTVSGLLLYARTDEAVQPAQTYRLAGSRIDVRTLDLTGDFSRIESALRRIAGEFFPARA